MKVEAFSYSYDAYGNAAVRGVPDTANPYTYNAAYTDITTGNQYLRARYYNPHTGNFLTGDSYPGELMEPLSRNLYTYTENNPVNFDDPSGHGIFSAIKKRQASAAVQEVRRLMYLLPRMPTEVRNLLRTRSLTAQKIVCGGKQRIPWAIV